eukprot:scaffold4396_cov145-Skeletonema_marinoi.AAC.2
MVLLKAKAKAKAHYSMIDITQDGRAGITSYSYEHMLLHCGFTQRDGSMVEIQCSLVPRRWGLAHYLTHHRSSPLYD